jgi:hemerythrin-like domain-containing protein
VALQSKELPSDSVREDFSEYVAHLQLHMTLQARNLLPTLSQTVVDSREQLLHQTQATFEKLVSRQAL